MPCKRCGSFAINHNHHGRDGTDAELCDVCYWRNRYSELEARIAEAEKQEPVCYKVFTDDGDYVYVDDACSVLAAKAKGGGVCQTLKKD